MTGPARAPTRQRSRPAATAILEQRGQMIWMRPVLEDLVREFASVRHQLTDSLQCVRSAEPLVWPYDEQHLVFFAGLEPLVVEWLWRRGYIVRQNGNRWGALPSRAPIGPLNSLKIDEQLLGFVQHHERGLVRYAGGVRRAWLIAQLALAWPTQRLMVWASRVGDADQLQSELEQWLPGEVNIVNCRNSPATKARICIATYQCLQDGAVQLNKRELCVLLNPDEVFTRPGIEAFFHIGPARMYGLLPDHITALPPRTADRLLSILGSETIAIPRHGWHCVPTTVIPVRPPSGRPLSDSLSPRELTSQGIWHNDGRNRFVAAIARAIRSRDATFRRCATGRLLEPLLWSDGLISVAVLAANVDHAVELGRFLPNWTLHAGEIQTSGLTEQQAARLDDLLHNWGSGSIATPAGLQSLEQVNSPDVLIDATGSSVPYAGQPISTHESRNWIVDIRDRHPWELRRRANSRMRHYEQWDCEILGRQAPSALHKFLANRPTVVWP